MTPRISIIIPVFNEEGQLGKILSHILTTNLGNDYEILVVDGGSTDDTKAEALRSKVQWLVSDRKGRAAQMNYAARHATTEILFFMHADTYPPAGFLRNIGQCLNSGFDAGCFRLRFHTTNRFLRFNAWFTRFNLNAVRFGDQGLFVTRNVFRASGGFREDHIVLEDQEMVCRLKKSGAKFKVLPFYMLTSARKYELNGAWKLQYTFFLVWWNYYRGKSQQELIRLYKKRIKDTKINAEDALRIQKTTDDFYQKPGAGAGKNSSG